MMGIEEIFASESTPHPFKYTDSVQPPRRKAEVEYLAFMDGDVRVISGTNVAVSRNHLVGLEGVKIGSTLRDSGLPGAMFAFAKTADMRQILDALKYLLQATYEYKDSDNVIDASKAIPFLDELSRSDSRQTLKDRIVFTIDTMFTWISEGSFSTINLVLESAKIQLLAPEILVSVLRATANYQDKLSNWGSFLSRTRTHFETQNLESDKILRGL